MSGTRNAYTTPPNVAAHPLVKFLAERMVQAGLNRVQLAELSGVGTSALQRWWDVDSTDGITLQNLEKALAVLGYSIKPVIQEATRFGVQQTKFLPGRYVTREGLSAVVERVTEEGHLIGRYWHGIKAQWNAAGRRIPVGGSDPTDLMLDTYKPISPALRAALNAEAEL